MAKLDSKRRDLVALGVNLGEHLPKLDVKLAVGALARFRLLGEPVGDHPNFILDRHPGRGRPAQPASRLSRLARRVAAAFKAAAERASSESRDV